MNTAEFQQLLGKAQDAKRGGRNAWSCQSTGEKLAVAMVLNRADWLQAMGYTMAEAIDRVGTDWVQMLRSAERVLREEDEK